MASSPSTTDTARRIVSRVESKAILGPDSQVDNKAIIIVPGSPALTDPFLLLAEDWFSSPGFEWHPHRGLETVTLVLDGVLEHGDSGGNAGALEPGDVQWMTAGRGIIHRELAFRNEHAHTLQLWVNLPSGAKMVDTRYQDLRAADRPRVEGRGSRIDIISGRQSDADGLARNHWPITGAIVTLEPGASVDYALPAHDRAFAYVINGTAAVAGQPVHDGQIAWSDPLGDGEGLSTLPLTAAVEQDGITRIMVYSGRPIGEPVAFGGPFVMNTHDEIRQAFTDFHTGQFGPVPRQARLTELQSLG
jgi:redox-sensitive bicupin YhaK (pirin superfamily)